MLAHIAWALYLLLHLLVYACAAEYNVCSSVTRNVLNCVIILCAIPGKYTGCPNHSGEPGTVCKNFQGSPELLSKLFRGL
jgi:hypothetical protein